MTRVDYRGVDLESALRAVGARPGDAVFVMSNLGFFGVPEGGLTEDNVFAVALGAFDAVLGPQGTICAPAFTYSFCRKLDFEPARDATKMGLFAERLRKLPETLRSEDPIFSVTARGAKARRLVERVPETCFGPGSVWERLIDENALFCHLNFLMGPPLIHYHERRLGVSYRQDRWFSGTLVKDGAREPRRAAYFSRNLDVPGNQADPSRLEERAEQLGLLKRARAGRGFVLGMRARDFGPLIESELKADPLFLTLAGRAPKEARA